MTVNGAKIFNDGVWIDRDCEEKIKQIVNVFKAVSPSPEINIRFLKRGKVYEGLLWGSTNSIPIGVYRQGTSLSYVLDNMQKRVKKECLKVLRLSGQILKSKKSCSFSESPSAVAG